jgi:hypothetical protein
LHPPIERDETKEEEGIRELLCYKIQAKTRKKRNKQRKEEGESNRESLKEFFE